VANRQNSSGNLVVLRSSHNAQVGRRQMGTPGRRRALRALSRAKARNARAAAAGKSVTIGGKKIKASTYKKKFGLPKKLQKKAHKR
jgi:hypothetical protein